MLSAECWMLSEILERRSKIKDRRSKINGQNAEMDGGHGGSTVHLLNSLSPRHHVTVSPQSPCLVSRVSPPASRTPRLALTV